MNDFKESLKYKVDNIKKNGKKLAITGALALTTAASLVGCGNKESEGSKEQIVKKESQAKKEEDKMKKMLNELQEDIKELSILDDEKSIEVTNILNQYVQLETVLSKGANPNTYNLVIPDFDKQGKMIGHFNIADTVGKKDKRKALALQVAMNGDNTLDETSMNIYNKYEISEKTIDDAKKALEQAINVIDEKDVETKDNDVYEIDLSKQELLDLIKASYVAAYNNNQIEMSKDEYGIAQNANTNKIDIRNISLLIGDNAEGKYGLRVKNKKTGEVIEDSSKGDKIAQDYEPAMEEYDDYTRYLKGEKATEREKSEAYFNILNNLKNANEKYKVSKEDIGNNQVAMQMEETK